MSGDVLGWLPEVVPELIELVENRYTILRYISFIQPVGRRSLADGLSLGERFVRRELDFLRGAGYIQVKPEGVWLTPQGEAVVAEMEGIIHRIRGLATVEEALRAGLNVGQVIIVPGDLDHEEPVRGKLGEGAARVLLSILPEDGVLAVMGGSTLAEMVKHLPLGARWKGMIVPAQGGLGENVDLQANTVAAHLARNFGAQYRLLHVPDFLEDDALNVLLQDPRIRELHALIRSASVVLTGIGRAEFMARRRGMPGSEWKQIRSHGAVGEAFGYYFDLRGNIVGTNKSLGLRLEDLNGNAHIIAVAGGSHKAEAILAVSSHQYIDTLVIDEGAARRILTIIRQEA